MKICYLCGKNIDECDKTNDHVPPQRFFPTSIRKRYNLSRLKTLPTHRVCNEQYQKDEEYCFVSIGASDNSNPILKAVWDDMKRMAGNPATKNLRLKVWKEFIAEVKTQAGISLPGIAAKQIDVERMRIVFWKITRGLFFIEFNRYLPEFKMHVVQYIHGKKSRLDDPATTSLFIEALAQEERGVYKGIFIYKYIVIKNRKNVTVWAYLLWNRHMFFVMHHNPDCTCEKCAAKLIG